MREVGRAEHASTEQLSALLDGRAEPAELVFLAGHVEQCVVCSHELGDLRSVRGLLRALPVYLPPRSFTIPIEVPLPPRRFRRLIPLTRALGTVAAVLCVVLFSVDAMQTGYEAPMSVPDGGAGAMHLTTRATPEAAQDATSAEARTAVSAASESAKPVDAAPKVANAPAAPAAKPAAAFAPAATQVPLATPAQTIGNTVTATPAGVLARPAESSARAADSTASGRAESVAAAPPAPQPAAAAAPAQAAGAAAPPPPAPTGAPPQPAVAQQAPGAPPKPQAAAEGPAPQPTSAAFAPQAPLPTTAAFVPQAPAPTVLPAPAQRSSTPSPWLSPIRLWALGFALVAAGLLIGSLVLSRVSRTRGEPSDEWLRS